MINIYQALVDLESKSDRAALCTVIASSGSTPRHVGSKMLVFPDGHILGSVGGGELESRVIKIALQALSDGNPQRLTYNMSNPERGDVGICGGQVEIFVEPILPPSTLVVVGGGHVGKAVAHLGKWLGFRIVISDDRPEYCTPEFNPDADVFLPIPLSDIPSKLEVTPQTVFVLTTRGTDIDSAGLPVLLRTNAGYIGVIGSRRRWSMTVKSLREQGVSEEQITRVRSPIGLGISAETPEEIAVSILAEILLLRGQGSGRPMKEPK